MAREKARNVARQNLNIRQAISRYMDARGHMDARPIPPRVLRDYLDATRALKLTETGKEYSKRLVITGDWSAGTLENGQMILLTAIEQGWDIEARL